MERAISVIIPTFNRPQLLRETVESVLAQTLPPLEVIIVDDGSEEMFEEAIRAVSTLSDGIVLYRLPKNSGPSAARNFGLEKARGDWVLFLDDDDIIGPAMLEACMETLGHDDRAGVLCCRSDIFYSGGPSLAGSDSSRDGGAERVYYENPAGNIGVNGITAGELLRSGLMISCCLVRRRCLATVRFHEDLTVGEDMVFWLTLTANGIGFKVNPSICAHIRRHGGNACLRPGYGDEKIKFLKRLLADGLIRHVRDLFLVHGWLFVSLLKKGDKEYLEHLAFLMRHPRFLPGHMAFYLLLQFRKRRDTLLRQRLSDRNRRLARRASRP